MKSQSYEKSGSLNGIHNSMESLEISDFALINRKITTKIDTNKNFSCIHIYKNTIYIGTRNSKLYIYKVEAPKINSPNEECSLTLEKTITPHCEIVSLVTANEKYFVTVPETDEDSMISIWDSKSKMMLTAIKGHKSQVSQVIFLKNQKFMATASWDCSVRVWTLEGNENWEEPITTNTGNYPVLVLKEFNEEILVFGGDDCYLVFWNWRSEETVRKEFGHAGSVTYIELLGEHIFTAGGDNKFKLWQVALEPSCSSHEHSPSSSHQPHPINKYTINKLEEQKQSYNSIIFGVLIDSFILLCDREGSMFVYLEGKEPYKLKNHFEYNDIITGMGVVGYELFVTTTKGAVKHFNLREFYEGKNEQGKNENNEEYLEFNIVQVKSNDMEFRK